AVAFESLFKLGAMLALGTLLFTAVPATAAVGTPPPQDSNSFPALILLGALAMFTMPHQFHAGVVECRDGGHVRTARWLFPLYLVLISLPILPLARLGDSWLRPLGVPSDLYVLVLPLARGDQHGGGGHAHAEPDGEQPFRGAAAGARGLGTWRARRPARRGADAAT